MGHDASMEVGDTLTVKVDSGSTRYKEKIEKESSNRCTTSIHTFRAKAM